MFIHIFQGKRIVDEYEWKYDNYVPLVSNDKLIIYEIHIGDFQDKFKDVTAKIDYFVELGITAGKWNIKKLSWDISYGCFSGNNAD